MDFKRKKQDKDEKKADENYFSQPKITSGSVKGVYEGFFDAGMSKNESQRTEKRSLMRQDSNFSSVQSNTIKNGKSKIQKILFPSKNSESIKTRNKVSNAAKEIDEFKSLVFGSDTSNFFESDIRVEPAYKSKQSSKIKHLYKSTNYNSISCEKKYISKIEQQPMKTLRNKESFKNIYERPRAKALTSREHRRPNNVYIYEQKRALPKQKYQLKNVSVKKKSTLSEVQMMENRMGIKSARHVGARYRNTVHIGPNAESIGKSKNQGDLESGLIFRNEKTRIIWGIE